MKRTNLFGDNGTGILNVHPQSLDADLSPTMFRFVRVGESSGCDWLPFFRNVFDEAGFRQDLTVAAGALESA